jgi:hypothetical protein
MTKPGIRITFDSQTGQYTAHQEVHGGLYGGFGTTPEAAIARLELAKSRWSNCELCRQERLQSGHSDASDSADPRDDDHAAG